MVHQGISKPEVGSAEVDYDASTSPEEIMSNDARSIMGELADALCEVWKRLGLPLEAQVLPFLRIAFSRRAA